MRRVSTFLLLTLVTLVISGYASAQTNPTRIQFAKGKSSAVVKNVTGKNGVHYVIRARSGQMLVFDLTPASKVGIKVEFKGRYGEMVLLREERGGHYEVGLEQTGDYRIFIGSTDHKPVSFSLTVKTRKLADI